MKIEKVAGFADVSKRQKGMHHTAHPLNMNQKFKHSVFKEN